jgi:hypothetical protein
MSKLIGTAPNQVPTNADLGTMAYQDYDVIAPQLIGGRRNLIINGAMQVWQRGTSDGPRATNFYYGSADRWMTHGSGGTYTSTKYEVPVGSEGETGGCSSYFKFDVTTSSDYTGLQQRIENPRAIPSNSLFTVSFYIRGVAPSGGLIMRLDTDNTGAGTNHSQAFVTVPVTSTWTRFTHTYTRHDMTGSTIDEVTGFTTLLLQQYSDSSTTAWHIDITGVQLELGSVATPFEHRSYGEELALCQRYYQTHTAFIQQYGSSAQDTDNNIIPVVTMRATPSTSYTTLQSGNLGAHNVTTWSNSGSPFVVRLYTRASSTGFFDWGVRVYLDAEL